jgi:hypothetical protein
MSSDCAHAPRSFPRTFLNRLVRWTAATILILPPASAPGQGITVNPKGTTVSQLVNTNGHTATFVVQNLDYPNTDLIQLFCGGGSGPVTCVSVSPSSVTLAPGNSQQVTATYNVGAHGFGVLQVIGHDTRNGFGDIGWYNVNVLNSYQVTVALNGSSTSNAYFTVENAGLNSDTYTITCTATGSVTCTGTSLTSVTLTSLASQPITATYTLTPPSTGTLTLTATSSHATGSGQVSLPEVAVATYHNDQMRTGWNQNERTLTQSNVGTSSFGLLATVPLDDQVDAQPLVVPSITISGGTHDVVYVVTESNTIYAVEAATGTVLLSRNLGAPVPKPLGCRNNGANVGTNGTPTIDVLTQTLYVITYTTEKSAPVYRIHAIDLGTLADKDSSVVITASHTLSNGNTFTFLPQYQRQRPALLQAGSTVYAGFGSFCDMGHSSSRGWLLGWQSGSLVALPANQLNDRRPVGGVDTIWLSSIWMSGYGISADSSGNAYFLTGNSMDSTNDDVSFTNIQESAVEVTPDLTHITGIFTPPNHDFLDQRDSDFASGGVLLLPTQTGSIPHLAVAAGKFGLMYLLNRDAGLAQIGSAVTIGPCWCGLDYFVGPDGVGRVVSSGGAKVIVWRVQTSPTVALVPDDSSSTLITGQDPGFMTSVSSNGTQSGTAVVWAVGRPTNGNPANVTLYAINPTSGATLFSATAGAWPSTMANANIVPVVANGKVYIASNTQLSIFSTH